MRQSPTRRKTPDTIPTRPPRRGLHAARFGESEREVGALAAVDAWAEGLQLDQLKIYEGGELNETLYRVLKDNIRFPESSLGDMKSQMAACRLAARRMDM